MMIGDIIIKQGIFGRQLGKK